MHIKPRCSFKLEWTNCMQEMTKCESGFQQRFDAKFLLFFFSSFWRNEGFFYRLFRNPSTVEIDFNQRSGLKMKFSYRGNFPNQRELTECKRQSTERDFSVRVSYLICFQFNQQWTEKFPFWTEERLWRDI